MKKFLFSLIVVFAGLNISQAYQVELNPEFAKKTHDDFKEAILREKISLKEWALSTNSLKFVCLGETHLDPYRKLVAEKILPHMQIQRFFVEAEENELQGLIDRVLAGEAIVKYQGADYAGVLRAVQKNSPNALMNGVEETAAQELWRMDKPWGSRDGYIAQNIMEHYDGQGLSVALYGALHCATDKDISLSVPFYHFLQSKIPAESRTNAVMIQESWKNKFSVMLMRFDLAQETFVIPDTSKIPPSVYNYNMEIQKIFKSYKTIIYFGK